MQVNFTPKHPLTHLVVANNNIGKLYILILVLDFRFFSMRYNHKRARLN